MSNVLQIDRNGIDEAVNDLQELINEINEVNISKSKQEGDEGMAYTAIQEGEKIIENVKTDLQGLIQATADFIVKINAAAFTSLGKFCRICCFGISTDYRKGT